MYASAVDGNDGGSTPISW